MNGTIKLWAGPLLGLVVLGGGYLALAPAQAADPAQIAAEARTAPARINGKQARSLVAQGARLVDVRTPAEFRDGHVDGAVNVPLDQLEARSAEIGAKDQAVVLYCHSGRRSALAARKLAAQGFTKVYDLGPKSAW